MTPAAISATLLLASVLALAAVQKIRHPGSALSAMRLLRLPAWIANARLAAAFPWAELLLAAALLVSPAGPAFVVVASLALLLMATYWGLIARGLTMTPRPTCGCFGAIGSPVRGLTLVRNTVLLAFAAVTLAMAARGESALTLLFDLEDDDWWWLIAAMASSGATALVLLSERPRALTSSPATQPSPPATSEVPDEDGMLDYERSAIPSQLLLEADSTPVPLRRLAASQAQLLLWVTCGCPRSHAIVEQASAWREAMPQIGVRLVSAMSPEGTEQSFGSYGEEFLYDPEHTAFTAFDFRSDPGAVLLGADGLLAGGPVWGQEEVIAFVNDVVDALSDAPVAPEDANP